MKTISELTTILENNIDEFLANIMSIFAQFFEEKNNDIIYYFLNVLHIGFSRNDPFYASSTA